MVCFFLVICLLGFVLIILPCAGLAGVCLLLVVFRLCCLSMLQVVLLSLWLIKVWLGLGVAGLEELEVFGRECDLPRKTDGSLVRRCDDPRVFHGIRWKRLRSCDEVLGFGAHDDKRGRFSSHGRVSFPREGVG